MKNKSFFKEITILNICLSCFLIVMFFNSNADITEDEVCKFVYTVINIFSVIYGAKILYDNRNNIFVGLAKTLFTIIILLNFSIRYLSVPIMYYLILVVFIIVNFKGLKKYEKQDTRKKKILFYIIPILTLVYLFSMQNFLEINSKIENYFGNRRFEKEMVENNKYKTLSNKYSKDYDFDFVSFDKDVKKISVDNRNELKNLLYTYFNMGSVPNTVFYCNNEKNNCSYFFSFLKNDFDFVNKLVHPFNQLIQVTYVYLDLLSDEQPKLISFIPSDAYLIASQKVVKKYNNIQIEKIEKEIDKIYKEKYDLSKSISENIKTFHDYIIDNTKYDLEIANSDSAYTVLFEKAGTSNGYNDVMSLFLEKMNIHYYSILNEKHSWLVVNVDGEWLHLDLSWDDPIYEDGHEEIIYDYFLITTEKLESYKDGHHDFNKEFYTNLK